MIDDIEQETQELLDEIDPKYEILSLSSIGENMDSSNEANEANEANQNEEDQLSLSSSQSQSQSSSPSNSNSNSNSHSYDDLEIIQNNRVNSYENIEPCSESGIKISEYLINFANYHTRHANPGWKNVLRSQSY